MQPTILALHVQDVLRQEVVVTDLRSPPLKVTALHATSPAIRASVLSSSGGVTKVQLEVAAAALGNGPQDAMLNIYTDDPLYSPLQLPIALTRAGKTGLAATPPQVQARLSADQPVASTLVRLRPAEGQKMAIAAVEADDPGVTCTWAAGPGSGATLRVVVDVRRLADRDGPRTVRVRLAEPPNEVLTIPVTIDRGQ